MAGPLGPQGTRLDEINKIIASLQQESEIAQPAHHGQQMQSADNDLQTLHTLVASCQACLKQTLAEISSLEYEGNEALQLNPNYIGGRKIEPLDDATIAALPEKDREAAIKRLRNREAARRSRQKKQERLENLFKEAKELQEQNALLIKCIEKLAEKSIASTSERLALEAQLTQAIKPSTDFVPPPQQQQQQFPLVETDHFLTADTALQQQQQPVDPVSFLKPRETSPSRMPNPLLALPSLEAVARQMQQQQQQQQQPVAAGGGELTARGAAKSALAEHMAMLSKDNSPRDDELGTGAGNTTTTAPAAAAANVVGTMPVDTTTTTNNK